MSKPKRPWLWFIGLWLAGLATVLTLSYAIRFMMFGFPELIAPYL